ncbi:hypothetical protein ACDT12_13110 [Staphylococcus aureus]
MIKTKHLYWRQVYNYGKWEKLPEFRAAREKAKTGAKKLAIENQNKIAKEFKLNPKTFWNHIKKVTKNEDKVGDRSQAR